MKSKGKHTAYFTAEKSTEWPWYNCGNHLCESTTFSNDPLANDLSSQQLYSDNCLNM